MSWKVFKMGHVLYPHSALIFFLIFDQFHFPQCQKLKFWVSKSFCKGYQVPALFDGLSGVVASAHQLLSHSFSPDPGSQSLHSLGVSSCLQTQVISQGSTKNSLEIMGIKTTDLQVPTTVCYMWDFFFSVIKVFHSKTVYKTGFIFPLPIGSPFAMHPIKRPLQTGLAFWLALSNEMWWE